MFQRLYKHNNLISSKNDKRDNFERNRKIRRSQAFDFLRGPEATTETQTIRSKPLKDIQNILKEKIRYRDLQKKTVKKKQPPPFVVGIVRHKIYSPPFLHTSQKVNKSTKKKITSTPQQPLKSFAPKNYKFKPPKGLKVDNFTPSKCSPFTLGSTLGRHQEKNVTTKEVKFENVTMRSRMKKLSNNCLLSTNSITPKIKEDKYESVKKQLWSEESNEVPIFGRLNVARALRKSVDKLPTDNENEENKTSLSKTFENEEISSINMKLSENIHNENKSFDSPKFCNKNKYVFSRMSRISSPNLSRISFTPINTLKQNTEIEDSYKTTENYVKYNSTCASPILSQNLQWNTLHSPEYGKLHLTRTISNVEDSSSSKSTILCKTAIENNISPNCFEESNNSLTKESVEVIKNIAVEKENKNLIALDNATQNSSNIISVSSNDLSNQEIKSSLQIIEKKSMTKVSNENRFSYEKKAQNVKNLEYLRTSKSCVLNCSAIINKDSSENVNKPETATLYSKKTEDNTRKNQDKEMDNLKRIIQDSPERDYSLNHLFEQEPEFSSEGIEDKTAAHGIVANRLSCETPTNEKDVNVTPQAQKSISISKDQNYKIEAQLRISTNFELNSYVSLNDLLENVNVSKTSSYSKEIGNNSEVEKCIVNSLLQTSVIYPTNEKSSIITEQLEQDNFARKNKDDKEMDNLKRIIQDSPERDYSLNHLFEQEPEFSSKGIEDKTAAHGIVATRLSCETSTNEKGVEVTPQAQKNISINKDQNDKIEAQLHISTNFELNSYASLNDLLENVNVSKTSSYSKEIGNNSEVEKCIVNSLPQTSVIYPTNEKSSIITEQLEQDNFARKNKDYTEMDDLRRIIQDSPERDYSLNHLFEQEPEFSSKGIEDKTAVHGIIANRLSCETSTNEKGVKVTPQAQKKISINKDQNDKIEAQLRISTNFELNSYTSLDDSPKNVNVSKTSLYSKKIEDIPPINEKSTTFTTVSEDTENNSSCTTSIISPSYKECTAVSLQTKSNISIKNDTRCEDRSDAVPSALSGNSNQKYNLNLNNFENITSSEDTVNNSDHISPIKILINDCDITASSQSKEIISEEKNDQNLSRDLSFSTSNVNSKNNFSNTSNKMLEKVNLDECDDKENVTKILNTSSSTSIKRHECVINIFSPATTEKMASVKKISGFESMYTNKEDLQVIDLIDSPEVDKKPIIANHISENKIEVNENSIIDLVSDDEDDHVSFLSRVIATHAIMNAVSPMSTSNKAAIASVKNIPKIQVSPQKTPRSYLISKENSPIATDVGSPARVLSLRSRVVNATPSPKRTPKKTRPSAKKNVRTQIILKEISPLPSQVASPTRVLSLRNRAIDLTPSPKKPTKESRVLPQKTLQIQSVLKENSPIKNTLASPVRVLTLRSRAVDVTPSPTKLTPRRRKKENVQ